VVSLFRKDKKDDRAAAEEHYTRGQWSQALQAYLRLAAREPDNVKVLRRVADLQARAGRREDAAASYRKLAELYAHGGFLVQAIAIQKILLRLDPSAEDVGRALAELYGKRGLGPRPAEAGRRPLPEIPLFSDLDPEAFSRLVERLVPRTLALGEVLFRQGDPGDSIFVVTSGAVRVRRGDQVLAELGEGTFFGEGAFFSHEPRNAEVAAVVPTELLEIRREDTEDLLARFPGVASALLGFYKRRVLDGVLAASPLFGLLPEGERRLLADRFAMTRVAPGQVVVREGDADRALYLVKRGSFAVTARAPGGSEPVRLAELGPGTLFGEVALVSRAPRTATVTALAEGEVLRVAAEDLEPVLAARPELRRALERLRDERAAATISQLLGRPT
jgi:cAMP-dependent protein kinase regulator